MSSIKLTYKIILLFKQVGPKVKHYLIKHSHFWKIMSLMCWPLFFNTGFQFYKKLFSTLANSLVQLTAHLLQLHLSSLIQYRLCEHKHVLLNIPIGKSQHEKSGDLGLDGHSRLPKHEINTFLTTPFDSLFLIKLPWAYGKICFYIVYCSVVTKMVHYTVVNDIISTLSLHHTKIHQLFQSGLLPMSYPVYKPNL